MGITINTKRKFEKFSEVLCDFPLIRIALVSVLCGIAFLIFNLSNISVIFFAVAGISIITRIFSSIFASIEHILMEISMVSFWLGILLAISSGVVSFLLPDTENATSGYLLTDLPKFVSLLFSQGFANESVGGIIVLILTIASSALLFLFVIMLIIRIAVALFSSDM